MTDLDAATQGYSTSDFDVTFGPPRALPPALEQHYKRLQAELVQLDRAYRESAAEIMKEMGELDDLRPAPTVYVISKVVTPEMTRD